MTLMVAVAAAALVPKLVDSAPAASVLVYTPCACVTLPSVSASFCTVTVTVQVPGAPDGIVPPDRLTEPVVVEAVPPQVVAAAPEVLSPAGSVSVNAALVAAEVLLLDSVIVSVAVPRTLMLLALNALV